MRRAKIASAIGNRDQLINMSACGDPHTTLTFLNVLIYNNDNICFVQFIRKDFDPEE